MDYSLFGNDFYFIIYLYVCVCVQTVLQLAMVQDLSY